MRTHSIIGGAFAALMLALSAPGFAAGTAAGTDVSNTATVDFEVGGVNQPDETSNTVTFEVDRVVNLTVAEVGTADTNVASGQQNAATTFTVTNTGNAAHDFLLTASQDTTGTTTAHGDTDDFDMQNVEIYLDDGDGVFDGGDTLITFLEQVPADATRTVHIVADVPLGQANATQAGVTLTAQAAEADGDVDGVAGAASTETAGAEAAGTVDTVFGDGAGEPGDTSRDGRHSDDDAYEVQTPTIAVVKSSRVISDPFNGTTDPKRIPGATVEYCIEVTNSGSATADAVVVSDDIDEVTTTFVAASGLINSTDCDSTDGAAGGAYDGDVVTGSLGTVANGATERFQFRVTID